MAGTPILPYFKLTINDDDNTGVYTNAFVDEPAHQKYLVAFNKAKTMRYFADEEQRTVVGVMMSADTPIYRMADDEMPEHYVMFDASTIRQIQKKFNKNQLGTSLNEMHDPDKVIEGVYMFENYTVGGDKSPAVPAVFDKLNLQDGSWIAKYQVDNDDIWQKVKNGEFKGFSVEGFFNATPVELKKKFKAAKGKFGTISEVSKWDIDVDQDTFEIDTELTTSWTDEGGEVHVQKLQDGEYMLEDGRRILVDSDGIVRNIFKSQPKKMKKKSWFKQLFSTEGKFAEVTAVDGTVLMYEGELAADTAVFVEADGEQTPAPEGAYQVSLDGVDSIINVSADGLVTSVEVVPDDEEMSAEFKAFALEFKQAHDDEIKEIKEDFEKVTAILKAQIDHLQSFNQSKFGYNVLTPEGATKTEGWKQHFNKG